MMLVYDVQRVSDFLAFIRRELTKDCMRCVSLQISIV